MSEMKCFRGITSFCLSLFLLACGGSTTVDSSSADSNLVGVTKEVEIFDTTYEIGENWFIDEMSDTNRAIYFQDTKPEKVTNAIFITRAKDVLSGSKQWVHALDYLARFRESLVTSKNIDDSFTDELIELKETPVLILEGKAPNTDTFTKEVYLFMNSYKDVVMLQYYHDTASGEPDYSGVVRNMVKNMKLSYDGFLRATPTPETNSGTSTNKKSCDGEPYSAGSKWANYDKDGDGCINDSEFQAGMGDAIEEKVNGSSACDGEPYGAGSDWAKYDKNGDGCINDSEFQAGMGDAIDNRVSGTSSGSSTSDRTGLCEFKENGKYVCNKKAMSGYSFCKEHWELLNNAYNSLVGD